MTERMKIIRLQVELSSEFRKYMDELMRREGIRTTKELVVRAIKQYGQLSEDQRKGIVLYGEDSQGNRFKYLIL